MASLDFTGAGLDLSANAHAPFAPWARDLELMALPYRFEARPPDGVDCMAVVEFAQARLGRPVKPYASLYAAHALDGLDRFIRAEVESWAQGEGDVGDVLVMGRGGLAHHVAVLCGAGHAIHARSSHGVTVDRIAGRRRVKRFCGARLYGVVRPA